VPTGEKSSSAPTANAVSKDEEATTEARESKGSGRGSTSEKEKQGAGHEASALEKSAVLTEGEAKAEGAAKESKQQPKNPADAAKKRPATSNEEAVLEDTKVAATHDQNGDEMALALEKAAAKIESENAGPAPKREEASTETRGGQARA